MGSSNDYDYTDADPVNQVDLDGLAANPYPKAPNSAWAVSRVYANGYMARVGWFDARANYGFGVRKQQAKSSHYYSPSKVNRVIRSGRLTVAGNRHIYITAYKHKVRCGCRGQNRYRTMYNVVVFDMSHVSGRGIVGLVSAYKSYNVPRNF